MKAVISWVTRYHIVLLLFAATAVFASAQSILLGNKKYLPGGLEYNTYNNYTIFKQSFYHLIDKKDLYILYPLEHWDLYKYSPTFSLLFGIFALLPDAIGLTLWNLVNALVFVMAIFYLPYLTQKQKGLMALVCIMESMTAIQNEQSNGLMAGLIILAFALAERKQLIWAALCLVLTVYIKIFGLVAFSMFLFYKDKWKIVLYTVLWSVILFLVPLIVIDFYQLKFLYKSWSRMLSIDHSISQGLSVIGWLKAWFGIEANKIAIALSGAILFMLPFVRIKLYSNYFFRLLSLSSILIWIVIFNHKAESPTFIIAMAGCSIWFFMRERTWPDTVLFISAFIFTTLSPTDLFPPTVKQQVIEPYVLKVVPCILIWARIIHEMMWETKAEAKAKAEVV